MKQDEELNNKIIERMIDALNDMLRLAVQYPDYSDYEPHYKPCRYFMGAASGIALSLSCMPFVPEQYVHAARDAVNVTNSGIIKFRDNGTPYVENVGTTDGKK